MKCLIIGPSGSGKTTLCNALVGYWGVTRPTQMFKTVGNLIDTPGVYMEYPTLYQALIVSSQQADCVLLMIGSDQKGKPLPSGFAQSFPRPVIGIISKTDLGEAKLEHAKAVLADAGVKEPYFYISSRTLEGLDKLNQWIIRNHQERREHNGTGCIGND
ncbi:Propanediol utilization protein PduV [Pelotomaculum schinkii]|uniref:Propanediol utilization protein PduV n=1 Tax=Pelotomaculum schinkii TaxID=78350 RepID=A0A4Y7R9Q6_9FIRM|nr:EutP/PduV family microcompartment system protein [Pelotomaculum schinkii]TEB05423.1 Propanediol utilization protein PduV [Pelotomaculum schinkii]